MAIAYQMSASKLEFDLKVNFVFNHTHVFAVNQKEYEKIFPSYENDENELELPDGTKLPPKKKDLSQHGYLIFLSTFDLQPYDSNNDGAAYIRPSILAIQGIICFLTGSIIIPADFHASLSSRTAHHIQRNNKKGKLRYGGVSYSKYLNEIISVIENAEEKRKIVILSLLDRWRKAMFLLDDTQESQMYSDEAILSFFHIWELLAVEFAGELANKIQRKFKSVINSIFSDDLFLNEQRSKEENDRFMDFFNETVVQKMPLRTKIIYLFDLFGMRTDKTDSMIERYLKFRNDIAHGKSNLYEDRAIFPLQPFFSQVKDIDENSEPIMIGTAKAIASYLGMKNWDNAWEIVLKSEPVPKETMRKFIRQKIYESYPNEKWFSNNGKDINTHHLTYYLLRGQVNIHSYETCLSDLIIRASLNEENSYGLLYEAILLADSKNLKLASKCQALITEIKDFEWAKGNLYRNVLKELQYKGFSPKWFEQYLIDQVKEKMK